MRPSALFREYEETEDRESISFRGVLHPRYCQIPKSQIAFSILGNKEYRDFDIDRKGEEVDGIIIKKHEDYSNKTGKDRKDTLATILDSWIKDELVTMINGGATTKEVLATEKAIKSFAGKVEQTFI